MTSLKVFGAAIAAAALLGAAGCVTINVYFPAAAAEKAADKIIEEVWGEDTAKPPDGQSSRGGGYAGHLSRAAWWLVEYLVPKAHAQDANLDISTPAIKKLEDSMRARHQQLLPYYKSGAVGLTSNGLVAVRDAASVPLSARNTVNQLVADENNDRKALYREIAAANGHPEWTAQIQETFARRWIDRAQSGWYYQAKGGWQSK